MRFEKGHKPWNKNLKVDRQKYPNMGNLKIWENCSYMGKHKRIWQKYGKADKCENLSCPKKCLYYEWANISGKYKEDRNDWKMMCCHCHKIYDLEKGIL